ncbi:MAG: hypothetical protein CVV51_10915 [Spirochaetae bacterium HGW-Spirochaetae-7]|nr:MAG: hypothetical protein CVV51_10915 [Spirochaetae bacterium HGW-Spirochaetae-7]
MPTAYAGATAELAAARQSYSAEAYGEAKVHAETVEAYLADVTDEEILPAFYIVEEKSPLTDCLWRIAEMPFIYGDPLKWPALYRANRAAFPDPNNPDLILPGMKLAIPSIQGELREGLWTEGLKYPTFPATK